MSRRGAAAQKQEHRAACYYWAMRWAILFLFVGMFTIAPQQLLSQELAGEKPAPRSLFSEPLPLPPKPAREPDPKLDRIYQFYRNLRTIRAQHLILLLVRKLGVGERAMARSKPKKPQGFDATINVSGVLVSHAPGGSPNRG
jgi:hypothetical protein